MIDSAQLGQLPLLVFTADIGQGRLRLLDCQGGLLARLGATLPYPEWMAAAIHPDSLCVFCNPDPAETRQLVRLRASNQEWHWFSLGASPGARQEIARNDGELAGELAGKAPGVRYTGFLSDARTYKALQDTAQRYRDFTELSSDWYWEMDEQHRFSYFSREFEQVSGVASSSALGKTRWDGLGRERLGNIDWEAHRAQMNAHRPFRNFEYPSRRQDGRIVWFRVSGRPRYDDNGHFVGYYGIASDISATRRIEEHLQQSERLASIGQLAAGVAHEINNPVGFVRSNLETLHHYVGDLLGLIAHYERIETHCPDAGELAALHAGKQAIDLEFMRTDAPALLDECRNGLDRVRKIVADLREFSCEGTAQWSEFPLENSVESALNLLSGDVLQGIDITRDYAALPPLHGCPPELNQVFLALLRNAAQAIAAANKPAANGRIGHIAISSGQDDSGQQWLEITDSGCGIAPENLPRIFEPFFSTRPVGQGTGMGLATCFGIVKGHGGSIDVHSTPGAGASFRVSLPNRSSPAQTASPA